MHNNKNCWIIGCSSGIGKELAIKLYNEGYNFCLSARNQQELLLLQQQLQFLKNYIAGGKIPCTNEGELCIEICLPTLPHRI